MSETGTEITIVLLDAFNSISLEQMLRCRSVDYLTVILFDLRNLFCL